MRVLAAGALVFLAAVGVATADEPSARPLPGNKPCSYPQEAQQRFIAGPVHFVVQVRPDGTVASVEVKSVPMADVGFEQSARSCLSKWRFEPAAVEGIALRHFEDRLRFRLDATEETAVRRLLERLAAAWNAGDTNAVEDLATRPADSERGPREPVPSLREQLVGKETEAWHMDLEPEIQRVQFFGADFVSVKQAYRHVPLAAASGQVANPLPGSLEAMIAKGSRGWRFVRVSVGKPVRWGDAVWIGGPIREPRKVKDVRPNYPEDAKTRGIQGTVVLEAIINTDGRIERLSRLHGVHGSLDEAAMKAVRQWQYTPTLLNGTPVPVIMTVHVNFRLSFSTLVIQH
jgi:TonB family protein